MDNFSAQIAVIGGGPAGLRAAEVAAAGGARVTVFDAKASVGRKFLVAGGGGLNLTKAEAPEQMATRYRGPGMPGDFWVRHLADFGPEDLRAWAAGLGVETFIASTGRVYPRGMKAAPLLRSWVRRLRAAGVDFAMHHRLTGLRGTTLSFSTPAGPREVRTGAALLALGGGSWPETGSDGAWVDDLRNAGIEVAALQPANCGWTVEWPAEVIDLAGTPLKNVVALAHDEEAAGELMLTSYGLEGGAIYALGAALRNMPRPEIRIDLKPGVTVARLIARFGTVSQRVDWTSRWDALTNEAGERWRLGAAALAILRTTPPVGTVEALAAQVKDCRVSLGGPRPLAEAISSAGGVPWPELDAHLMLRRLPGVFVAGEMIDWEAPTGGYLMQGAFVTGGLAARGALDLLSP